MLFESLMQVSEVLPCCSVGVKSGDDWSFDLLSVIKIDIVQGCIIIMVLTQFHPFGHFVFSHLAITLRLAPKKEVKQ